jgi:class 3 adenylate cyclase/YHS domain-containing protein
MEATIVFLDLVRFTSLTDVHGDVAGADAAGDLAAATIASLVSGVRLVKTLGDGVLMCAADSASALRVASAVVERIHGLGRGLDLRGGADHGPVVERDGDVFGTTVNVAARAAGLTSPGSLAATRAVALEAGAVGLVAEPLGEVDISGFAQSIELFEIDLCAHDGAWITDPVCGMRLDPDHVTEWVGNDLRTGFCSADCASTYRLSPERFGGSPKGDPAL